MRDIRDDILRNVTEKKVTATIIADDDGIVAETAVAEKGSSPLLTHLLMSIEKRDRLRYMCSFKKGIIP